MTSNPKLTVSFEDLGDGEVLTTLTIRGPSRFRSHQERLEQARRAWDAVRRVYSLKCEADAFDIVPNDAVRH